MNRVQVVAISWSLQYYHWPTPLRAAYSWTVSYQKLLTHELWFLSQIIHRAANNQLFVAGVSPAQDLTASYHAWGHSMLCNPWCVVVHEVPHFSPLALLQWMFVYNLTNCLLYLWLDHPGVRWWWVQMRRKASCMERWTCQRWTESAARSQSLLRRDGTSTPSLTRLAHNYNLLYTQFHEYTFFAILVIHDVGNIFPPKQAVCFVH